MTKKIFTSFISVLIFLGQAVFANSYESNFWKERQTKIRNQSKPLELAYALPHLSPQINSFPNQFSLLSNPDKFFSVSQIHHHSWVNNLPSQAGSIRDSAHPTSGPSKKVVVLVQDIHMNQEAQKNISLMVSHLHSKNSLDFIALEGFCSEFKTGYYRKISSAPILASVAEYLLEENKISGPIYASLTMTKSPPLVFGVDDPFLHKQNVASYLTAQSRAMELEKTLLIQERHLRNETIHRLNPKLAAFDTIVDRFRKNEIDIGQYVEELSKHRPLFGMLDRFRKGLRLEKSLDFKRVEIERASLLSALVPRLSEQEKNSLIKMGIAFKNGAVNAVQFHQYLTALADRKNIRLSNYPEFRRFMDYVLITDGIEGEKLFAELKNQEDAIYSLLFKNQREKDHVDKLNLNRYSKKLLTFGLTRQEWESYRYLRNRPSASLISGIELFESFYAYAEKRDQAMAQSLIDKVHNKPSFLGVLVIGGFHSSAIASRLTQAGLSVFTFTPKISAVPMRDEENYLSVFAQEKTPLEKLVMGEKLFLSQDPTFGKRLIPPLAQAVQTAWARSTNRLSLKLNGPTGAISYELQLQPSPEGSGAAPRIKRVTSRLVGTGNPAAKVKRALSRIIQLNDHYHLSTVNILVPSSRHVFWPGSRFSSWGKPGPRPKDRRGDDSTESFRLSELRRSFWISILLVASFFPSLSFGDTRPTSHLQQAPPTVSSLERANEPMSPSRNIETLTRALQNIQKNPFNISPAYSAIDLEQSQKTFDDAFSLLPEDAKKKALAVLEHPVTGAIDFYLMARHLKHVRVDENGAMKCRLRPERGADFVDYKVHMKMAGLIGGIQDPHIPNRFSQPVTLDQLKHMELDPEGKLVLIEGDRSFPVHVLVSMPVREKEFRDVRGQIAQEKLDQNNLEEPDVQFLKNFNRQEWIKFQDQQLEQTIQETQSFIQGLENEKARLQLEKEKIKAAKELARKILQFRQEKTVLEQKSASLRRKINEIEKYPYRLKTDWRTHERLPVSVRNWINSLPQGGAVVGLLSDPVSLRQSGGFVLSSDMESVTDAWILRKRGIAVPSSISTGVPLVFQGGRLMMVQFITPDVSSRMSALAFLELEAQKIDERRQVLKETLESQQPSINSEQTGKIKSMEVDRQLANLDYNLSKANQKLTLLKGLSAEQVSLPPVGLHRIARLDKKGILNSWFAGLSAERDAAMADAQERLQKLEEVHKIKSRLEYYGETLKTTQGMIADIQKEISEKSERLKIITEERVYLPEQPTPNLDVTPALADYVKERSAFGEEVFGKADIGYIHRSIGVDYSVPITRENVGNVYRHQDLTEELRKRYPGVGRAEDRFLYYLPKENGAWGLVTLTVQLKDHDLERAQLTADLAWLNKQKTIYEEEFKEVSDLYRLVQQSFPKSFDAHGTLETDLRNSRQEVLALSHGILRQQTEQILSSGDEIPEDKSIEDNGLVPLPMSDSLSTIPSDPGGAAELSSTDILGGSSGNEIQIDQSSHQSPIQIPQVWQFSTWRQQFSQFNIPEWLSLRLWQLGIMSIVGVIFYFLMSLIRRVYKSHAYESVVTGQRPLRPVVQLLQNMGSSFVFTGIFGAIAATLYWISLTSPLPMPLILLPVMAAGVFVLRFISLTGQLIILGGKTLADKVSPLIFSGILISVAFFGFVQDVRAEEFGESSQIFNINLAHPYLTWLVIATVGLSLLYVVLRFLRTRILLRRTIVRGMFGALLSAPVLAVFLSGTENFLVLAAVPFYGLIVYQGLKTMFRRLALETDSDVRGNQPVDLQGPDGRIHGTRLTQRPSRPFYEVNVGHQFIEGWGRVPVVAPKYDGQEEPWFKWGPLPPFPTKNGPIDRKGPETSLRSNEKQRTQVSQGENKVPESSIEGPTGPPNRSVSSSRRQLAQVVFFLLMASPVIGVLLSQTSDMRVLSAVALLLCCLWWTAQFIDRSFDSEPGQGILEIRKSDKDLEKLSGFDDNEINIIGLVRELLNPQPANPKINALIMKQIRFERPQDLWKVSPEDFAKAINGLLSEGDLQNFFETPSVVNQGGVSGPDQIKRVNKQMLRSAYPRIFSKPKKEGTVGKGQYGRWEYKFAGELGTETLGRVSVDATEMIHDILDAGFVPDDNNQFFHQGREITFKEAERIGFKKVDIRPYKNLSLIFANLDKNHPDYMRHAEDRNRQVSLRSKSRFRIHVAMLVEALQKWRAVYSRYQTGEASLEELQSATGKFWEEDFFSRAEVKRRDADAFFKTVGRFLLRYADEVADRDYHFDYVPKQVRREFYEQSSLSKFVHYLRMLNEVPESMGAYERIAFHNSQGDRCNLDFNMRTFDYEDPNIRLIDERTGMLKIPLESQMKRTYKQGIFIFELKWAPKVPSRFSWRIGDYLKNLTRLRFEGEPPREIFNFIAKYELLFTGMAKSPDAIDKWHRPDKFIFGYDAEDYDPEREYFELPPTEIEQGLVKIRSRVSEGEQEDPDENRTYDEEEIYAASVIDPVFLFISFLAAVEIFGLNLSDHTLLFLRSAASLAGTFFVAGYLIRIIQLNRRPGMFLARAQVFPLARTLAWLIKNKKILIGGLALFLTSIFPSALFAQYGFAEPSFLDAFVTNPERFFQLYNSLVVSVWGGWIISNIYQWTQPGGRSYDYKVTWTLKVFPITVAFIMWIFSGSSLGFALNISLLGILGIVNFRTIMKNTFESMYILAALSFGLASALGEWLPGLMFLGFIALIVGMVASVMFGVQRDPHLKVQFEWWGTLKELNYFEENYLSKMTEHKGQIGPFHWGPRGYDRLQAKPTRSNGHEYFEVDYRVRLLNPTAEGMIRFKEDVEKFAFESGSMLVRNYLDTPANMEHGFILVLIESVLNVLRYVFGRDLKPIGFKQRKFATYQELLQSHQESYGVNQASHENVESLKRDFSKRHQEPLAKLFYRSLTWSLQSIVHMGMAVSLIWTIPMAGIAATQAYVNGTAVYSSQNTYQKLPAVAENPDYDLSFVNTGTIVALLVKNHDRVEKGQLLALLQKEGFSLDLFMARKQLALAAYEEKMGQIEREISLARSAQALDQANLSRARSDAMRLQSDLSQQIRLLAEKQASIEVIEKQLLEAVKFSYPQLEYSGYSRTVQYGGGTSTSADRSQSSDVRSGGGSTVDTRTGPSNNLESKTTGANSNWSAGFGVQEGQSSGSSWNWSVGTQSSYQAYPLQPDLLALFQAMSAMERELALNKAGLTPESLELYSQWLKQARQLEEDVAAAWTKIQPPDFQREIGAARQELAATVKALSEEFALEQLKAPESGRLELSNDTDRGVPSGVATTTRFGRIYDDSRLKITIPIKEAMDLPSEGASVKFTSRLNGRTVGFGRVSYVPKGKTEAPEETWGALTSTSFLTMMAGPLLQPPLTFNVEVEVLPEFRSAFSPGEVYNAQINAGYLLPSNESQPSSNGEENAQALRTDEMIRGAARQIELLSTEPSAAPTFLPEEMNVERLSAATGEAWDLSPLHLGMLTGFDHNRNTGQMIGIDGLHNSVFEFDSTSIRRRVDISGLLPTGKENFGAAKIKRLSDGRVAVLSQRESGVPPEIIVFGLENQFPHRLVDPVQVFRFPSKTNQVAAFAFNTTGSVLYWVEDGQDIFRSQMGFQETAPLIQLIPDQRYVFARDGVSNIQDMVSTGRLQPGRESFVFLTGQGDLLRYALSDNGGFSRLSEGDALSGHQAVSLAFGKHGPMVLINTPQGQTILRLEPGKSNKSAPISSESSAVNPSNQSWANDFSQFVGSQIDLGLDQATVSAPTQGGMLNPANFSLVLAKKTTFSTLRKPGVKKPLNEFSGLTLVPEKNLFVTIDDEGYLIFFDREFNMVGDPFDLNILAERPLSQKGERVDPEALAYLGNNELAIAFEAPKKVPNLPAKIVVMDISNFVRGSREKPKAPRNPKIFKLPPTLSTIEGLAFNPKTSRLVMSDQEMKHIHWGTYKDGRMNLSSESWDLSSLGVELGDLAFWEGGVLILTKGRAPKFNDPRLYFLHIEGPKKGTCDASFLDLSEYGLPQAEGLAVFNSNKGRTRLAVMTEGGKKVDIVVLEETAESLPKTQPGSKTLRVGLMSGLLAFLIIDTNVLLGFSPIHLLISVVLVWLAGGFLFGLIAKQAARLIGVMVEKRVGELASNEILFVVLTERNFENDAGVLKIFKRLLKDDRFKSLRDKTVVVYVGADPQQALNVKNSTEGSLFVQSQYNEANQIEFDRILALAQEASTHDVANKGWQSLKSDSTRFASVLSKREQLIFKDERLQERHRFLSAAFTGLWGPLKQRLLDFMDSAYRLSSVAA